MTLSALQGIILDFDGVVADSEPLHLRAFQQVLAEEGILLTAGDYYSRYLGYDDVGMFQALARDGNLPMTDTRITELVARKGEKMQAMMHGDGVLFPGAIAFIQTAAAAVPLAIASGALRHEIMEIVEAAGVAGLFMAIVAAGDTPQSTPSPAPYLLAFERLRQGSGRPIEPHRCVAVEDSHWGLESARRAGLRCVGVTNSYPADQLEGAELIVSGLNTLTLEDLDRLVEERR
jgi:beta-phosphoglucomutase